MCTPIWLIPPPPPAHPINQCWCIRQGFWHDSINIALRERGAFFFYDCSPNVHLLIFFHLPEGSWAQKAEAKPLLSPPWNDTLYTGLRRVAILNPSHAPLLPLFLKSLATSLQFTVNNFREILQCYAAVVHRNHRHELTSRLSRELQRQQHHNIITAQKQVPYFLSWCVWCVS